MKRQSGKILSQTTVPTLEWAIGRSTEELNVYKSSVMSIPKRNMCLDLSRGIILNHLGERSRADCAQFAIFPP